MREAGGHGVDALRGEERRARAADPEVLVDDLNATHSTAPLWWSPCAGGELRGTGTLAFYAHTDQDTRRRAEQAGYDVVVPRSRMAREGAAPPTGWSRSAR